MDIICSNFVQCECLSKQNKYAEAEVLYTKGISALENLGPQDFGAVYNRNKLLAKAYNNRGHVLYKQVKFNEAITDYTMALKYDSEFAVAFYNRGTIYYRLGDFQLAVFDMEKAVSLEYNPEFLTGLDESKKQYFRNVSNEI